MNHFGFIYVFSMHFCHQQDPRYCFHPLVQATNQTMKKPAKHSMKAKETKEQPIPLAAYYLAINCQVCKASWIWFSKALHRSHCICGAHWNESMPSGLHMRLNTNHFQEESKMKAMKSMKDQKAMKSMKNFQAMKDQKTMKAMKAMKNHK